MKRAVEQIRKLDELDQCTISEAMCKVLEELGEFTAEVNKMTGRKHTSDTTEKIKANLLEECADTFQNLLLVMSRFDITLEQLEPEILKKDRKWFKKMYLNGTASKDDFFQIFGEELTENIIQKWIDEEEERQKANH